MADAARKLDIDDLPQLTVTTVPKNEDGSAKQVNIQERLTPELVICLCGPMGVPLSETAATLKEFLLSEYLYEEVIIHKLSTFIKDLSPELSSADFSGEFDRIDKLIKNGNKLRELYGSRILAEAVISEISKHRNKNRDIVDPIQPRRRCYIIDSLKNESELNLFRDVYRENFYLIGVNSLISERVNKLRAAHMQDAQIYSLIDTDSGEEVSTGQQVSAIFPKSDYFLRLDNQNTSDRRTKIERLLKVIFKSSIVTPTAAETAMYSAFSAAANSACLSRQVGACILSNEGIFVSVGWNDVPKFTGRMYQVNDDPDNRCYNYKAEKCCNDHEKNGIVETLSQGIKQILRKSSDIEEFRIKKKDAYEKIITEINEKIAESSIGSLIEFSRAVHAEMHAIISAPHREQLFNADLYCTTYPCHSCARHIVLAGIRRVFYIEPYKKSKAIGMHDDSICEDEKDEHRLQLLMFEGVSPRRFLELFKENEYPRKSKGGRLVIPKNEAIPKTRPSLDSFPALESAIFRQFEERNVIRAKG